MTSIKWTTGAVVWLLASILAVVHSKITMVAPVSTSIYSQVGGQFKIEAYSEEMNGKMDMCHQKTGSSSCDVLEPQTTANFVTMKKDNRIEIRYTPNGLTPDMAGTYKISLSSTPDGTILDTKSVNVTLVTIESTNSTVTSLLEEQDVSVKCTVSGLEAKYSIRWMKDGEKVTESDMERSQASNDGTFTVERPKPKDVGPYTCVVTPEGTDANLTAVAYILSPPFVDEFGRGKNLVQGDMVVIQCHVYGYPLPEVTWTKDEKPLKPDNRTTISEYNGVPGAELRIQDLVMEDRAEYGCVATNEYNSTTQFISIRVKDKYAALWPFLGICAEVIILCAIIFLYEKRRNRKNAEKEKSPEKSSSQNGNKEVRQRNVKA